MIKTTTRFIALCLFLLSTLSLKAQTWQIGTGTTSNNFGSGANPYPCPFGNYYSGMRAQYIYRATELTAAGMTAGLIHQLAWNVTNVGSSGAHLDYTLRMTGITATSLTAWQTGATQVYNTASYQPVSGWNTFTLSSPYNWNGTDNIVVEVCFWNGASTYTDNARVQLTTALGANTSIDYYDDLGGPYCNQNSLSQNSYSRRPNIKFTRLAACSGVPTAGTASAPATICPGVAFNLSVTGSTSAAGITYQWQSGSALAGPFSNIPGATTATYNVAGGITAPTWYRLNITCTNSSQTATSNVVAVGLNSYLSCFCTPSYIDGCGDGDDINTITLTGAQGTTINQVNNPCPSLNSYTNYTSLPPVKMLRGQSYTGTINTEYSDEGVKFWIDFNNNGLFESSEVMTSFDGVAVSPALSTYTLAIPATAAFGIHRMRVRLVFFDPIAADIEPCVEYDFGETRDYNVRILPPAPVVTAVPNPVCEGATVTLTATSTVSSPVFIWTGPNGYTATGASQTLTNITAAQAGTYSAKVAVGTDTSDAATVTVTVKPLPTAVTAGSNSPVCAGTTLNLVSGSTATGVTYAWTGPNTFTAATQNPSVTSVTTAAGGTYTVTASLNGCTATASTTVVVNPSPTGVTASNNGPICAGNTLNLTGNSTTTGVSYSWAGPNTFSSATQNPSITNATTAATGTYTLTATLGSCNTTATTNAVVNPIPAGVTAGSNSPVCAGSTLNLTGGSTTTGVSYSWAGPNSFTSATQNPSIVNVTAAAAGTYTLTAAAGSCTSTATTAVVVKTTPVGVTASNNGPICAGNTLNLTGNSTTTGVSYAWTGPNTFNSATQNPSITNATTAASGTYTLTVSLNGCSRTVTTNALVNANPVATATAVGNTSICQGDFVTLQANTGAGLFYQWKNNGNPIPGANSATYNATTAGSYTVTVSNTNSCNRTSTPAIIVTVVPLPPSAITNTTPLNFCDGQSVTLHAPAGTGYMYLWYLDGTLIPGATNDTYVATFAGTYTLRVTAGSGCTQLSAPVTVTVFPVFTPIISRTDNILSTAGYTAYQWYYNNSPIPGATGASIAMTQNGYYQVLATDANGCTTTSAIAWIQNLGINNPVRSEDIKIFPNPATTEVHIVSPVKVSVQVRNMQGQLVLASDAVSTVDISKLANGVYMITVLDKSGALLKTGRLVKSE